MCSQFCNLLVGLVGMKPGMFPTKRSAERFKSSCFARLQTFLKTFCNCSRNFVEFTYANQRLTKKKKKFYGNHFSWFNVIFLLLLLLFFVVLWQTFFIFLVFSTKQTFIQIQAWPTLLTILLLGSTRAL